MASINKLSIRGVRAFSPDDVEQVVEFYFPCTIIVGQNGCGKTTIIESLKYAITGSLPPGNKSGQAFVHDPRSMEQSQVKANVKLRFTSRSGQTMVVVRSMELTQKKKTVSFKQLDGVLRMMDPNTGQRISLSHKCSELDKQLPTLLGISKAILDNVLFCHQEDASWPLQEGAVLKKRFDDIFDSTRYTKALEVFRKTEKELVNKVKEIKIELGELKGHKHAVEQASKELAEQNEIEEELQDDKKQLIKEIEQCNAEIQKYEDIVDRVEFATTEIDSLRNHRDRLRMALKTTAEMVETDLTNTHTKQQLQSKLDEFDREMAQQVATQEELQKEATRLQSEIGGLHKQEMDLKSQMGKSMAEKEAHEKRLKKRVLLMESIAQTYSVDLQATATSQTQQTNTSFMAASIASIASQTADGNASLSQESLARITPEDMQGFFRALEKKGEDLEEKKRLHKERMQSEEDRLQKALTDLGGRLKAVESEREKIASRKSEIKTELAELSKEVFGHARLRQSEVEEAKQNAVRLAKARDEANANPRIMEIRLEIRQVEDKLEKIKRKYDEDKVVLDSLRDTADAQNAITVLEEQCVKQLEDLKDSLREQTSALQRFNLQPGQALPEENDETGDNLIQYIENLHDDVHSKYDAVDRNLRKATDKASNLQKTVLEKKAQLLSNHQALSPLKTQLERLGEEDGCVSKVRQVIEEVRRYSTDFSGDEKSPETLLGYLDDELEKAGKDKIELCDPDTVAKVLKNVLRRSGYKDGGDIKCPCCLRSFPNDDITDLQTYQDNMKLLMGEKKGKDGKLIPSPLVKSKAVEEHRVRKEKLQTWRKIVSDNMGNLRDFWRVSDEVARLEKLIQQLEVDLADKQGALDDQNGHVEDFQIEAGELRELLDASKRWSEEAGRISEKKMQIHQKRTDLQINRHNLAANRDLKTVEKELSQQMEEKDALTNKMNELNKEARKLNDEAYQLAQQATAAENRAREKETKFAAAKKAAERKDELLDQQKDLLNEEKKVSEEVAPLRQKIRVKETEKQRLRSSANADELSLAKEANEFGSEVSRLRELTRQIDEYSDSSKSDDFDRLESKVSKLAERVAQRRDELRRLQPNLDNVRNAVKDQERHKNQLKHNIDMFDQKAKIEEINKEIILKQEEKEKIELHDKVFDLADGARGRKEKLLEKKAQTEGRYSEIVERIRSIKRKLSCKEYKDIHKRHQIAMIKVETTQIAADDLKKYQKALDQALLQYHSVKIAEVNKIIRELWIMCYKGEDIANIEIVSGQEPGSRATKSYNYRVVMTKGSSQLDMRGRCSAGQRVLASIVIRLALAETFGVTCGCIALDEPTVNLDYRNKRGLAVALAQIVSSRSQQRNFQLVLITHDEEFVGMMKTELASLPGGFSMPDKYFQVTREQGSDNKFYSKIHAIDWDEMP